MGKVFVTCREVTDATYFDHIVPASGVYYLEGMFETSDSYDGSIEYVHVIAYPGNSDSRGIYLKNPPATCERVVIPLGFLSNGSKITVSATDNCGIIYEIYYED